MHKRLSAATIVETIVALVIILVLFGITTTLVVQITTSSFSVKKIKAGQLIQQYAVQTGKEKAFFDEEWVRDEFSVQRAVVEYGKRPNLVAVTFSVYNNKQLVSRQQRLYRLK